MLILMTQVENGGLGKPRSFIGLSLAKNIFFGNDLIHWRMKMKITFHSVFDQT